MKNEGWQKEEDRLAKVHEVYQEAQLLRLPEETANLEQLKEFTNSWKDSQVPELQRKVVDVQLENLRLGIVDPVFSSLIEALKAIKLPTFSLLDAGCATGYYSEVIGGLEKREIHYRGVDYSSSMINLARTCYPNLMFDVQDLTQLTYPDRSFDVLLLSGVLEHVPDYHLAIAEACRVAKYYVILHRLPVTSDSENECTIGSQYNIKIPRIYFSRKNLIDEIKGNQFYLVKEIDVYPSKASLFDKVKAFEKKMIRKQTGLRYIRTLVFVSMFKK